MKALEQTKKDGFTLIELMVVIVILSILATVITPVVIHKVHEGRVAKVKTDISALTAALKMYKIDNGVYPSTEQGLQALIEKPLTEPLPKAWRKEGYIDPPKVPKDPWKNEYIYLCPGTHYKFDIISYGADGMAGGEDENQDLENWSIDS